MKINYNSIMEETVAGHKDRCETPSLLLHSCCAPCSSHVLELLSPHFFVTVYYYNPNIYPDEEFYHRLDEQKMFTERFMEDHPDVNPISFMAGKYEKERFYEAARGLEDEPERGRRCEKCFRLRLSEAARTAREAGMDYFCTTLSISPLKDAALLNSIGEEISREYGVEYLYSDFKKKNGFLRSTQLSEEYGMYRQDYCGCVYSLKEKEEIKNGTAMGRPV